MNCPSCGDTLSERGFFCKACGSQARCMSCREVLESGAVVCVECGTKVGQQSEKTHTNVPASETIAANRNTLNFHEDKNTRRFEASLTDEAMHSLGGVFGELFVQRGGIRTLPLGRPVTKQALLLNGQESLPPDNQTEADADGEPQVVEPFIEKQMSPQREQLLHIFTIKDDTFELSDNRLKATNRSDYLRRLTYLFIYAHEIYGRTSVPEEGLKNVLRSAKILDRAGNAVRWLNQRVGIAPEGEDRVKLNAKGREEATKALDEALDSKVPDTWNPDVNKPKKRGPRKKKKS